MKTDEFRKRPKHWLGMTIGAAAGLLGGLLLISEREVLPKDKKEFWLFEGPLLIVAGLSFGALVGRGISGSLFRIRQRNDPDVQREWALEREKRLADPGTMTCLEGACLFVIVVGIGCAIYLLTENTRATSGLLWGILPLAATLWVWYRRKHPRR